MDSSISLQNLLRIDPSEPYDKRWEVTETIHTLEIQEGEEGNMVLTQQMRIKSRENRTDSLYLNYVSDPNKIGDFEFDKEIGEIKSVTHDGKKTEVLVKLHKEYNLGKGVRIKMNSKFQNVFSNQKEEWWIVDKYYLGKCNYIIQIMFPKDRNYLSLESEIITPDTYNRVKKSRLPKNATQRLSDIKDTQMLTYETDELELQEQLKLSWQWNYQGNN